MHSPRIHGKLAGLAAVAGLMLTMLLGVPTAQAAQTPDSASPAVAATAQRAQAGALVNSPGISPAAERVRYVSSGTYSCPYGRLCVRVWDPNAGSYKVIDLYRCATYSLSYWNGGGGFINNQTTGTVARFYNQSGGVVFSSTAYDIAPAGWDWGPIWKIKNC